MSTAYYIGKQGAHLCAVVRMRMRTRVRSSPGSCRRRCPFGLGRRSRTAIPDQQYHRRKLSTEVVILRALTATPHAANLTCDNSLPQSLIVACLFPLLRMSHAFLW